MVLTPKEVTPGIVYLYLEDPCGPPARGRESESSLPTLRFLNR